MRPFDHDRQPSNADSRMFEMNETPESCQFAADSSGPSPGLANDAQAIEQRIEMLTGQLAELTRQLEALKAGNSERSTPDPFASDAVPGNEDVDPFSSAACSATSQQPGREELNEVFSRIRSSFDDGEERLDETPAAPTASQADGLEADEELVQPDIAVSATPESPREPESVAEILARMKASGQLDSDLELASDSTDVPGEGSGPVDDSLASAQGSAVTTDPVDARRDASQQPDKGLGGAEDDVQSYMSQLLNRLNGGTAADHGGGAGEVPASSVQVEDHSPRPEPVETDQSMLEPGEFVPSHVAPEKNANLAAMREIALESTRSAVTSSMERRRKTRIMISFSASLASLSAAGFTAMLSARSGDTASLMSVALTIIGLAMGMMLVKALLDKPAKK